MARVSNSPKLGHILDPPSEAEDNPTSESEDVAEEPCDAGISNAQMRKRIRNRSGYLQEQLGCMSKRWSKLLGRLEHWEVKQHGHWVWKYLIYKPVRTRLRRMSKGAKLHFGKAHALSNPAKSYKHPCKTKHPFHYEGIVDQFLKSASKVIEYGKRVVPEVTPVMDLERKRIRKNEARNEARARESSFVKAAV